MIINECNELVIIKIIFEKLSVGTGVIASCERRLFIVAKNVNK